MLYCGSDAYCTTSSPLLFDRTLVQHESLVVSSPVRFLTARAALFYLMAQADIPTKNSDYGFGRLLPEFLPSTGG